MDVPVEIWSSFAHVPPDGVDWQ